MHKLEIEIGERTRPVDPSPTLGVLYLDIGLHLRFVLWLDYDGKFACDHDFLKLDGW